MCKGSRQGQSRRKVARIVLALVVACAALPACQERAANDYASPESAVMAMFNAFARSGSDPDSAWAFLGPETRLRLEALAAQGPEGLTPISYLRFGWLPSEALVRDVRRVNESGRSVTLRLTTELEESFEITMFRGESGWQAELGVVELPPPAPPVEIPELENGAEEVE